jgi:hypothetical protein
MYETWEKVKTLVKTHPWAFALGIFVLGVVVILWWRRGASASGTNTSASNDLSSYYAAAAAATQSGNQLQMTQAAAAASVQAAQTQAATEQAAIAAAADVQNHQTAAAVDVAKIQADTASSLGQWSSILNAHIADVAGNVAIVQSNGAVAAAALTANASEHNSDTLAAAVNYKTLTDFIENVTTSGHNPIGIPATPNQLPGSVFTPSYDISKLPVATLLPVAAVPMPVLSRPDLPN